MIDKNLFYRAYVECALWSSTDPESEEPLDSLYSIDDLHTSAERAMRADCEDFLTHSAVLQAIALRDETYVAHDFWLTRNRHGAGFWDGDYPDPLGEELTELSHGYGEADLYVGDDGMVYQSGSETD